MQTHTVGARDFRRDLTAHLTAAEHRFVSTVITRNGKPAAVLMSFKALQGIAAELRHGLHAPDNLSVIEGQITCLEILTSGAPDEPTA